MLYVFVYQQVKLEEVFKICHEAMAGEHRGVAGTLDKFQRAFFTMSAHEKIRRLVDGCNTCLAKERSIQTREGLSCLAQWAMSGRKYL